MPHINSLLVGLLLGGISILAAISTVLDTARGDPSGEGQFQLSFVPGSLDSAGRFMGGTEIRILTTHGGKLYAGNGYWEDRPGAEGPQGAQILVLDGAGAHRRADHTFDERMPNGRPRDLAVSALSEVSFATDGTGARLPRPVSLLIASTWDLTGATRVFARDDATGAWGGDNTRAGSHNDGLSAANPQLRCAS
jgi:hypothetical protein